MRTPDYAHPALADFAVIASSFCSVVANLERRTPDAQLDAIHQLLPRAYGAALRLPDTSVLFEGEDNSAHDTDSPLRASVKPPPGLIQLADFLGTRRFYREIFDPYADASEPEVIGDIIDDLGDIYADLERGLIQWRSGASGEALWEWRFNFETHWAEHATSALRAIFALSAWNNIPRPTAPG